MHNLTYYYRFEPVGIDLASQKDVERHSEKLVGFSDVESRLQQLKSAFQNQEKARQDLTVTMLGETAAELSVFHKIKFKLFSKTVKTQCFSLCLTTLDCLYFYETDNFDYVQQIFKDFVEKHALPDVSQWECV